MRENTIQDSPSPNNKVQQQIWLSHRFNLMQ